MSTINTHGFGILLAPAGFSLEANKVFATLALAQEFIQTKPAAYVGSVISVTNDTAENNGIYWVESIGEGASLRPANDIDLSNYYTKEEVEGLIPVVPTIYLNDVEQEVVDGKINLKFEIPAPEDVDLSGYYTKEEADATFATKEEIPSLDGYATEAWVEGKGYLTEHQDISNLATKEEVNAKQDTIDDLETIRTGAAAGATALQADDLTGYATEAWVEGKGYLTEHQSLEEYAKTSDVDSKIVNALTSVYKYKGSVANYESLPTSEQTKGDVWNVEDTGDNYAWNGTEWDKLGGTIDLSTYATQKWVEGKGYLTSHQDISHLATKEEVNAKQDTIDDLETIRTGAAAGATALQADDLTGYATEAWVEGKGYLTEHQSLEEYAKKADLKTVATSGSYNDLTDTPDLTVYAEKTTVETLTTIVEGHTTTIAEHATAIENLNKLVVGGEGEGLEAILNDVAALKTTVGGEDSGLVKDVADLNDNKQDKLADGTDGQILIWSSNAWTPSDMPETLPTEGKEAGKILTVDTDGATVIWASAPVSTTVTKNEVAEGETQTWEIKQGETSVNVYSVNDTYNKTEVYTKAEVDSFFTWHNI